MIEELVEENEMTGKNIHKKIKNEYLILEENEKNTKFSEIVGDDGYIYHSEISRSSYISFEENTIVVETTWNKQQLITLHIYVDEGYKMIFAQWQYDEVTFDGIRTIFDEKNQGAVLYTIFEKDITTHDKKEQKNLLILEILKWVNNQ